MKVIEFNNSEIVSVVVDKNKAIDVSLNKWSAELIKNTRLKQNEFNLDNFTKKCYQYASEQDFSDENFPKLLEWWLHNAASLKNINGIYRYLIHPDSMDDDDPWKQKHVGYSGKTDLKIP